MSSYQKVKTAVKVVRPRSPKLAEVVLDTMKTISDIVGATLGPGGAPVLIERQEFGLPPLVTKDGVTVFSSLGFDSPIRHSIMESARDCAKKTVSDAGDGTTTATVLAYALVRETQRFHKEYPSIPSQAIVQTVQRLFETHIEPLITKLAQKVDFSTDEGRKILHSVAKVSANGETPLADAVLQCFDIVGDKGNVSLSEKSGPSGYQVEKVDGFPISTGYEDSCGKFMPLFINDAPNNRCFLENPAVVLYNGTLHDINVLMPIISALQNAFNNRRGGPGVYDENLPSLKNNGVVIACNGFSDTVLGILAMNWPNTGSLHFLPVVVPRTPVMNGEVHFLEDLSAVTGARVFNPMTATFENAEPDIEKWLGHAREFEMQRFRSNLIGINDEDEVVDRIDQVEQMAKTAISELDRRFLQERVAALSGGIAKLLVVGSSTGDIKERKDRADDAVRSVQGALKAGVLPGGCWALMAIVSKLDAEFSPKAKDRDALIACNVLIPALHEPLRKLLHNTGLDEAQTETIIDELRNETVGTTAKKVPNANIFDAAAGDWVSAFEYGILDSVPAVLEAIRNSISIATLLGTLGGVVVFERDRVLDRDEARAAMDYEKASSTEEANERW